MRLVPVKRVDPVVNPHTFFVICARCGGHFIGGRDAVYADLDGPAFAAYYCALCAVDSFRTDPEVE